MQINQNADIQDAIDTNAPSQRAPQTNDVVTIVADETAARVLGVGEPNPRDHSRIYYVQTLDQAMAGPSIRAGINEDGVAYHPCSLGDFRLGGPQEPSQITSRKEAEQLIAHVMIARNIVGGFHPDTPFHDYGGVNDLLFSEVDAVRLGVKMATAREFFSEGGGGDIYAFSTKMQDFLASKV